MHDESDKSIMIPDRRLSATIAQSRESVCHPIEKGEGKRKGRTEDMTHHLSVLEVLEEHVQALALLPILLDHDAGAPNDLARVALPVDLAETSPGAEDLSISDLDQVDFVLAAKSLDQLDVLGLSAGLDENAKMGLALVEGLGTLAKTTSKTIVNESVLQNLLKSEGAMRR